MVLQLKNIFSLVRTPSYTELLIDILHKEYDSTRPGVHLSDLIKCPLQSYFKFQYGVKNNEKTLGYFFDGAGIHTILQKLFDKHYPNRFKIEDSRSVDGMLTYTPDIIDTETNRILEIKTARSPVITKEPRADHVEQLKAYMAFSGLSDGVVIYHLLTKEQQNLFTQWEIHITAKEADTIRKEYLKKSNQLREAIDKKTPEILDKAADNPDKRWLCNGYCDYVDKCPAGQAATKQLIEERKANYKAKEYFIKLTKDETVELENTLSRSLSERVNPIVMNVWRLLRWKLGKTN